MKITKLKHACLDISDNGGRLIIDPGMFTDPFSDYSGISAVVITHVHQDHLDESKILKISAQNPSLVIFCTQQVADKLSEDLRITVPNIETVYEAGPFKLEFFGGKHKAIFPEWPLDQNYGVLVNDALYYPGDSFTPCPKPHAVTAAPSIAPWAKINESGDFIKQDSAPRVFPTHNAIASEAGNSIYDSMLQPVAEQSNKEYIVLEPGDSLYI